MTDMARASSRVERTCRTCSATFLARSSDVALGRGLFCSRRCACVANGHRTNALHPQVGAGNHNFKGWSSHDKRAYVDRFRIKYPEKARAHDAVRDAIKRGDLVCPTACEDCGASVPLQAHHEDYAAPLTVDWLCGDCHRSRDRERRKAS